jgi:hypothetical protein
MPTDFCPIEFETPMNKSAVCTQHGDRKAITALHFRTYLCEGQSSGHFIHLCGECLKDLHERTAAELHVYYRSGGK